MCIVYSLRNTNIHVCVKMPIMFQLVCEIVLQMAKAATLHVCSKTQESAFVVAFLFSFLVVSDYYNSMFELVVMRSVPFCV